MEGTPQCEMCERFRDDVTLVEHKGDSAMLCDECSEKLDDQTGYCYLYCMMGGGCTQVC